MHHCITAPTAELKVTEDMLSITMETKKNLFTLYNFSFC
jgi:hypothetical protein